MTKQIEAAGLLEQRILQREETLRVAEQQLAHLPEGPETLAERAGLLTNLGAVQSELGRREQALASTQEAVEHYRKLAAAHPDAFLPNLAMSLNNLGNRQSKLGLHQQALASTQEAVDIRRKLAAARPDVFQPDLAMSLNNLCTMQSELGLHEEALASAQEALEAIWPFFMALPHAFARNTGVMLFNVLERREALDRELTPELLQRIQTFNAKMSDAGADEG